MTQRLDRMLADGSIWRIVVALAVLARLGFVVAPFDVLTPVDAHELGRLLLSGHLPYRDFQLEYPPGAVLAFVLPGLAPSSFAPHVVALQALALDLCTMAALRRDPAGLRRYVLIATLLFPLASGGFDALPMACIAWAVACLASGRRTAAYWLAALGATVKLLPGMAWGLTRRWGVAGIAALGTTLLVLLAPLLLTRSQDVYLRYHLDRGVQQETLAASAAFVAGQVTGDPVEVEYRFRSMEIVGAETAGTIVTVVAGAALLALVARCWFGRQPVDPWLASFALLLVLLCGSKVLSPQFFLLAAPLAAALGRRWFGAYLVLACLTLVAFLDSTKGTSFMAIVAVRNVLLLGTAAAASWTVLARPKPTA